MIAAARSVVLVHSDLKSPCLSYKAYQCINLTGILVTLRVLFENIKADHIIYLPGPEEKEESSPSTDDLLKFTIGGLSIIERERFTRFDSCV